MKQTTSQPPVPDPGLDRLLSVEAELEQRMTAARGEAERLLTEARLRADQARSRLETEVTQATAELRTRLVTEREREVAAIRADAQQRLARFHAIDQAEIDALARLALEQLLGGSVPEGPP